MIVSLYESLVPLAAQSVSQVGSRSAVPVLSLPHITNVVRSSSADIAEVLSFSLAGDDAGVTIFGNSCASRSEKSFVPVCVAGSPLVAGDAGGALTRDGKQVLNFVFPHVPSLNGWRGKQAILRWVRFVIPSVVG